MVVSGWHGVCTPTGLALSDAVHTAVGKPLLYFFKADTDTAAGPLKPFKFTKTVQKGAMRPVKNVPNRVAPFSSQTQKRVF